jgi:hypothetical protein
MTDYLFEGCATILKVEGSEEMRVALGRCYLGPCLGYSCPRGIEFPVRSMSLESQGDIEHDSLAWATFSSFVECSEVNGGRPVTFGCGEQLEDFIIKVDDTIVLCGQLNQLLTWAVLRGKNNGWKRE